MWTKDSVATKKEIQQKVLLILQTGYKDFKNDWFVQRAQRSQKSGTGNKSNVFRGT